MPSTRAHQPAACHWLSTLLSLLLLLGSITPALAATSPTKLTREELQRTTSLLFGVATNRQFMNSASHHLIKERHLLPHLKDPGAPEPELKA